MLYLPTLGLASVVCPQGPTKIATVGEVSQSENPPVDERVASAEAGVVGTAHDMLDGRVAVSSERPPPRPRFSALALKEIPFTPMTLAFK